jgi:hypothetical protein
VHDRELAVAHQLGVGAEGHHSAGAEGADHRLGVAEVLDRARQLAVLDQEQAVAGQARDHLRLRVEDAVVPEVRHQ